jgi:hypothetical protein
MLSVHNRRAPSRIAAAVMVAAAIALVACSGDGDSDAPATPTERAGFTPPATAAPIPTHDFRTSTPGPADFTAVVTMDTDPATPAIDHENITAAVGASFQIGILINGATQPFRGYQIALGWDDSGILSYNGEEALMPQGLTVCAPVEVYLVGTLPAGRTGVYGGCLSPADEPVTHDGIVTTLTFTCTQPGTIGIRTQSVKESATLGTSLITSDGAAFDEELDHGIDVTCT